MVARNLTREEVIHNVLLEAQPTKEFVTTEEITSMVLYLASEDARSVTGSILSIDGVWVAH
jgi:3-hydroxybutyrate dehydrogenase